MILTLKLMTYYWARIPEFPVSSTENTFALSAKIPFYGNPSLIPYKEFFVPGQNTTFPLNYSFHLNGSHICKDQDPYLVIFVLSVHDQTAQREAVRRTWGSVANGNHWPGTTIMPLIKIVFLFGVHDDEILNAIIRTENEIHQDIVQANFVDSYDNLSLKVLMGFKWMTLHCTRAKFLMKTDEDSFIVLPKLLKKLESASMDNSILGVYSFSEGVANSGKNKIDKNEYPLSLFPPHCKGIMYAMPSKLAANIVTVANHFKYMRIEDVFITGVLAKAVDARHVQLEESEYYKYKTPKPCELSNGPIILSHGVNAVLMYQTWNTFQNPIMCSS
ncbi:hypothetical protein SNE40_002206 [Patella caerulea]